MVLPQHMWDQFLPTNLLTLRDLSQPGFESLASHLGSPIGLGMVSLSIGRLHSQLCTQCSPKSTRKLWSLIRGHNRRNTKWLPPSLYHCSHSHLCCQSLLLMWSHHHPSTQVVYTHHHTIAEHSSPGHFRYAEQVHTHAYTQLWNHGCK